MYIIALHGTICMIIIIIINNNDIIYRVGWDCTGKDLPETKLVFKTKCCCLSNILQIQSQPI